MKSLMAGIFAATTAFQLCAQSYEIKTIAITDMFLDGDLADHRYTYFSAAPVLSNNGDVVYRCFLNGPTALWIDSDEFIIRSRADGTVEAVVQEGRTTATLNDAFYFWDIENYQINDVGQVAFECKIHEIGTFSSYGSIFTNMPNDEPELRIRRGLSYQGLPPGVFAGDPRKFSLNQHGELAIESGVMGDDIYPDSVALFVTSDGGPPKVIAREWDVASGIPTNQTYYAMRQKFLDFNDNGDLSFSTLLSGIGYESALLHYASDGEFSPIVIYGDPAPGIGRDDDFGHASPILSNNNGLSVFSAEIRDGFRYPFENSGLFTNRSGVLEVLAFEGQPAPDLPAGTLYSNFGIGISGGFFDINDVGDILFSSVLSEVPAGSNSPTTIGTGVFLFSNGVTRLLAGPYDPVPGLNDVYFGYAPPYSMQVKESGNVCILMLVSNGQYGIFAGNSQRGLTPVALVGETLALEDGTVKTISQIGLSSQSMNEASEVAFWCVFDDDTRGIFLATPTTCLPDTNNDGQLTPADFTAWIDAFNNNLPECDQNGDNACTPADFSAWINNYNSGC